MLWIWAVSRQVISPSYLPPFLDFKTLTHHYSSISLQADQIWVLGYSWGTNPSFLGFFFIFSYVFSHITLTCVCKIQFFCCILADLPSLACSCAFAWGPASSHSVYETSSPHSRSPLNLYYAVMIGACCDFDECVIFWAYVLLNNDDGSLNLSIYPSLWCWKF